MRYTYLIYVLCAALTVVSLGSCSDSSAEASWSWSDSAVDADTDAKEMMEVRLSLPAISTRTSVGEDDGATLTPRWDVGDKFGLWIRSTDDADQPQQFEGPYTFTHVANVHDVNENIFVGYVPRMDDGEYDYYAVTPLSEGEYDASGVVVCRVPAVQSGAYDDGADIMWAKARGGKLSQQFLNRLDLNFKHLTHALKIALPERLLGEHEVTDLRINFPRAVAGELELDIASGVTTLKGNDKGVTLRLGESAADERRECWVYIAAGDMNKETVTFMAAADKGDKGGDEDETEYSFPLKSTDFGNLQAQHITPVTLPSMRVRPQCDFNITVDYERLGEPITALTRFTLGAGYVFPGLDMPDAVTDVRAAGHVENDIQTVSKFTVRMFEDEAARFASDGVSLLSEGLVLESDHTSDLVGDLRPDRGGFTMENKTANGFSVKAPYLFFEDFSQVINKEYGNSSASWFTDSGLDGWSGSFVTVNAGGYLDISTYIGTTVGNTGNRWGRCDSPTMSKVRDNIQVALVISYNIDGSQARNAITGTVQSRCTFGYHEDNSAIAGGSGNSPKKPTNIVEEYDTNTNSYSNSMPEKTHTIQGATKQTRFTWFEDYKKLSGNPSTVTPHMYIDNIRVSITQ